MGIYLHFLSLQNRLKLRENRLKLKWRKFGKKKRGMNGAVECRPRREMGRSTPFKVMAQDGIKGVHQHCVDTPSCVKLIIRPGCLIAGPPRTPPPHLHWLFGLENLVSGRTKIVLLSICLLIINYTCMPACLSDCFKLISIFKFYYM